MKFIFKSIYNVFRYCGKAFTILRNTVFNILFFLLVGVILFSFIPMEQEPPSDAPILRLDITGDIVEEKKAISSYEKFLASSLGSDIPDPETSLQDILDTIHGATNDDKISVLLLNLKHLRGAGLNQLQTIGQSLEDFKRSGKKVVAAENYYSQTQYFLAAYADQIILNPMGGVDLHGFGVYKLYFRQALEKLAINYNIFRVGSFKSAVEPLIRDDMSAEDRQQNMTWLTSLWQVYTDTVTSQRDIPMRAISEYTDNIGWALQGTKGNPAQLALDMGLVDQVLTRQQTNRYLQTLTPEDSAAQNSISTKAYLATHTPSYSEGVSEKPTIGLIIAEGNILPGKQPSGVIGGDSLSSLIKKARNDENIKALVLRINSGGGSAFASEVIRQQLLELKKSGKPVVVSMGSVAASGGYWIAANADQIWASESTITGSIGVFGAIPTFEKMLASVGVYSDGVGTTPLAAGLNLTQELPDQLRAAIQQTVAFNYDQFLTIVAEGRNLEKKKVAEIAQGRVYDGKTAQSIGLVDNLGSLQDAIKSAVDLAELEDYQTQYIRPPSSKAEQFMRLLEVQVDSLASVLGLSHPLAEKIHKAFRPYLDESLIFTDPQGIYAHSLINFSI